MKHIVTEIKLENGIAGLLIHVPDASVMTFECNFRAGEYLVDAEKWETAHIMEHMLLGANELIQRQELFRLSSKRMELIPMPQLVATT